MNLKEEQYHTTVYNVEKDPKFLLISEGLEKITHIKRKKKLDFGKVEAAAEEHPVIPAEVIKTNDEMIIKNYEVDFEDEEPDVKMSGGLRGIQALKVQRDYI